MKDLDCFLLLPWETKFIMSVGGGPMEAGRGPGSLQHTCQVSALIERLQERVGNPSWYSRSLPRNVPAEHFCQSCPGVRGTANLALPPSFLRVERSVAIGIVILRVPGYSRMWFRIMSTCVDLTLQYLLWYPKGPVPACALCLPSLA